MWDNYMKSFSIKLIKANPKNKCSKCQCFIGKENYYIEVTIFAAKSAYFNFCLPCANATYEKNLIEFKIFENKENIKLLLIE